MKEKEKFLIQLILMWAHFEYQNIPNIANIYMDLYCTIKNKIKSLDEHEFMVLENLTELYCKRKNISPYFLRFTIKELHRIRLVVRSKLPERRSFIKIIPTLKE